jgi:hypothetical protein
MNLALIIVGGLVLMTFFPSLFGYLEKRKKAKDTEIESKLASVEKRLFDLEGKIAEKDDRIDKLETDVSFVNKLIEDKGR